MVISCFLPLLLLITRRHGYFLPLGLLHFACRYICFLSSTTVVIASCLPLWLLSMRLFIVTADIIFDYRPVYSSLHTLVVVAFCLPLWLLLIGYRCGCCLLLMVMAFLLTRYLQNATHISTNLSTRAI
jgi:hypothetical protein